MNSSAIEATNTVLSASSAMSIMDWITFGIAVAGFLMSLATWVKDFITQRKHIEGKVLNIKSYQSVTYIDLLIENRSRLPISITDISLFLGDSAYRCTPLPKLILEHTKSRKGEVYERTMKYSTPMPIQISNLGATTVVALFEGMKRLPPDDATHLNLSISTNRGSPVKMTLELPEGWAALRRQP